jgi:hypothetical protein
MPEMTMVVMVPMVMVMVAMVMVMTMVCVMLGVVRHMMVRMMSMRVVGLMRVMVPLVLGVMRLSLLMWLLMTTLGVRLVMRRTVRVPTLRMRLRVTAFLMRLLMGMATLVVAPLGMVLGVAIPGESKQATTGQGGGPEQAGGGEHEGVTPVKCACLPPPARAAGGSKLLAAECTAGTVLKNGRLQQPRLILKVGYISYGESWRCDRNADWGSRFISHYEPRQTKPVVGKGSGASYCHVPCRSTQ